MTNQNDWTAERTVQQIEKQLSQGRILYDGTSTSYFPPDSGVGFPAGMVAALLRQGTKSDKTLADEIDNAALEIRKRWRDQTTKAPG